MPEFGVTDRIHQHQNFHLRLSRFRATIDHMTKRNDLTGKTFGRLVPVHVDADSKPGRLRWMCQCSCGATKSVLADSLTGGKTESCGCLRKEKHSATYKHNLIGQSFSRLTVIDAAPNDGEKTQWLCACSCGNKKVAKSLDLKSGLVTSCGCAKRERARGLAEINRSKIQIGRRFGMLTVLDQFPPEKRKEGSQKRIYPYVCLCDCAELKVFDGQLLTGGIVVSCGCTEPIDVATTPERAHRRMILATSRANRRARKLKSGGNFNKGQIDELFRKQQGKCAGPYCGVSLEFGFHRDHRVPLALGGSNDITNIELLCPDCNQRKRAKDPIDWAVENGLLL